MLLINKVLYSIYRNPWIPTSPESLYYCRKVVRSSNVATIGRLHMTYLALILGAEF